MRNAAQYSSIKSVSLGRSIYPIMSAIFSDSLLASWETRSAYAPLSESFLIVCIFVSGSSGRRPKAVSCSIVEKDHMAPAR